MKTAGGLDEKSGWFFDEKSMGFLMEITGVFDQKNVGF